MAEYLPPTETLPKFNEFVFDDAYSIEGLDRRVVHKAGTETITGNKTITGTLTANNTITSLTASVANILTGGFNSILAVAGGINTIRASGVGYNHIDSVGTGANYISTTSGGTQITSSTGNNFMYSTNGGTNSMISLLGENKMTSTKTNPLGPSIDVNTIEATGVYGGNRITAPNFGDNVIDAYNNRLSAQSNILTADNGTNTLTSNKSSGYANIIEATGAGDNKLSVTTGENLLTATTGTNKLTTANTSATANLIEATGVGGGNKITTTSSSGDNLISAAAGGNNTISTTTGVNTIRTTGALGTNTISSTAGATAITTTTGKASISSTTGLVELKTAALTTTGINIENTSTTAGAGITLKTGGGDITLTSKDKIKIGATTPLLSQVLYGAGLANSATGDLGLFPAFDFVSTSRATTIIVPYKMMFYSAVMTVDEDATVSGTLVLTLKTKPSNISTTYTNKTPTQSIPWSATTANSYTFYLLFTAGAGMAFNQGDYLSIGYTGGPAANEFGIAFYGYQLAD